MDVLNPRSSAYSIFSSMGSSDSDDDFQKSELHPQSRHVYLWRYSKPNVKKIPSRQSFSSAVTKAFAEAGAEVIHWGCCKEYHKHKDIHYHMAVNMTKLLCWKWVKEQIKSKWTSLMNHLVTLLLIGTFANQTRMYCIVKNTLTLEILAPLEPTPAWKPTRQKTVLLGSLVNLRVPFHQMEQQYPLEKLKPNALHLQMLWSTFVATQSGHTLVCKR